MSETNEQPDDRAIPAVDDLCGKYADAVTTLHRIYLQAEGYDIHKQPDSQNVNGFAGWMKSFMVDLKHELIMRHGVDV